MIVLSLFDGMSCGQLALNRAGIKYEKYFASEIDKWAIKTTQHHFPKTIHLGDVKNVKGSELPKIDLLIGGSPCKGFSRAGNGLNFNHPESKLFFEYVRILKEVNPKYFLLENVQMKKEWELKINKILGIRPLRFNSSWVSAQNRERLYWTNIPVNHIPKDKLIFLSDIVENGTAVQDKSYCIDSSYYKGGSKKNFLNPNRRVSQSDRRNMVLQINPSIESDDKQPYQQNRVYDITGKSPALMAQLSCGSHKIFQTPRAFIDGMKENNLLLSKEAVRKLTVKECCRLQTVPDDYFEGVVSNTQAYKMLGNGWTIDIIAFIFSFMKPQ